MAVDRVIDQELAHLASEVHQLSTSVAAIERRLAVLEAALAAPVPVAGATATTAPAFSGAPAAAAGVETAAGPQPFFALAGRTLLVLGGAYLLRALTESQMLSGPVGITLGLVYAFMWLVAAARTKESASATFHTTAACLIVLPLIWEASLRFQLMAPPVSATALGVFAAAGLVVAAGRQSELSAWTVAMSVSIFSVVLAVATTGFVSHAVLLIALGIATLWLGYLHNWLSLRWPVGALACAMVVAVTMRGAAGIEVLPAFMVQVLLFGAYLGSFAVRTLFLGRAVIPFEVVQSIGVIGVGFGGAVYLSSATGANIQALGLLALGFGAGGYGVAFAFVERRCPARNFFFYAAVALVYMLVGAPMVLGLRGASVVFALFGVTAGVAARRVPRVTLTLHGVAYVFAAAACSGLIGMSTAALIGAATAGWPRPDALHMVALFAAAGCALWPVPGAAGLEPAHCLPRRALFALFVWTAAGTSVALLVANSGQADAAWLAATRTVILVAAVLAIARWHHLARLCDGVWLVYPLLALLAVKLVIDDLPHGRPSTLTVGLAACGAALILAPRLLRQRR